MANKDGQDWNKFVYENVPVVQALTDLYKMKLKEDYTISEEIVDSIKELSVSLSSGK